jgi:hypothetical protein
VGKSKGHVLGSPPAKDPMEELTGERMIVKESAEIRWLNRKLESPWGSGIFLGLLVIVTLIYNSWLVLVPLSLLIICAAVYPLVLNQLEQIHEDWSKVPEPDLICKPLTYSPYSPVKCRGVGGGERYITALSTDTADSRLKGDLGRLLRAMSTVEGFSLTVQMWHDKHSSIVRQGCIARGIYSFLDRFEPEELEAYMETRAGVWKTRVTIIGHSKDRSRLKKLESAVRSVLKIHSGIIAKGLRRVWADELATRINSLSMSFRPTFHALGVELSEWLVRHQDELAGELEVAATVPGQFITPVRRRVLAYRLGVTYTPETGEAGPAVGLVDADIEHGLLICGQGNRKGILTLIISQLVAAGKRVVVLSRNMHALNYCSLSDDSIGMVLGENLVLNPVDIEGIDRRTYVTKLIQALEVMPNSPFATLTSASELTTAIGNAAAITNGTIADIKFAEDQQVSRASQTGMDAIDVLRGVSAAHMFYGNQTVQLAKLDEVPLSVIVLPPTNESLERFAWDLISIKLTSLPRDTNRVIVFESPRHFKSKGQAFKRRTDWVKTLAKHVKALGPMVISTTSPAAIGSITKLLDSIITTQLREDYDIAKTRDLLKLMVYEGLHTRARQGHRATGVLSTLKENEALFLGKGDNTAIPVRLDLIPTTHPIDAKEMNARIDSVREYHASLPVGDTMIELVSKGDQELVLEVLKILKRYEPASQEGIAQFIKATGYTGDVEGAIIRLVDSGMIVECHSTRGSTTYAEYRITMKGKHALDQAMGVVS